MDGILIQSIIDFFGLKPGIIIIGGISFCLLRFAFKRYKEAKKQAKNEAKKLSENIKQENNSLKNSITILSKEITRLESENILLREKIVRLECELEQFNNIEMKGGN